MPAFLEPNPIWRRNYVLRGGKEATEYGKPYEWSCTVRTVGWWWPWRKRRLAEVVGLAGVRQEGDRNRAIFRDIQVCLGRAGFTHFRWDRRKSGEKKARPFEYPTIISE